MFYRDCKKSNGRRLLPVCAICVLWISNGFALDNGFAMALSSLCDALLKTQITDKTNTNYGALVCPSSNPDTTPIHSRAAEAVYPFAVEYKLTGQTKYRDAAIALGDWLTRIQETTGKVGGWSENWPDPGQTGWYGTMADQLVSLAGAFPLLESGLTAGEVSAWNSAISKAADYVQGSFPLSNVNYDAVGGVALRLAYGVSASPKASWLAKADILVLGNTLDSVGSDGLLHGEGQGVDEGYDMAQSIGYLALYARIANNDSLRQRAVDLLHAHFAFVYPNGSVDNSWGTRSYKWDYESGTKTAPGVYFAFALLASADPAFNAAGLACLQYLNTKCMNNGWVTYGPRAQKHASCTPPCNYPTFTRAQSLALAIEYAPNTTQVSPFPAQTQSWFKYYPSIKVALVRTRKIMATVSAYGDILTYSINTVPKGGSICNLWYEGFGDNGYLQSSSATVYTRTETMHMPVENSPVPLPITPRIESTIGATYYTNLYETAGIMSVAQNTDHVAVTTSGKLCSQAGAGSAAGFQIVNRFYDSYVRKEITVSGAAASFKIIEPFVRDSGTMFAKTGSSTVTITPLSGGQWTMHVDSSSTVPYTLTMGTDSARYWCPFPAVEAYPVIVSFSTTSSGAQTIALTISGPPATGIAGISPTKEKCLRDCLCVKNAHIWFHLANDGYAMVNLYSADGRMMACLFRGWAGKGDHTAHWNGEGSGKNTLRDAIYICVLSCGGREMASVFVR